MIIIVKLKNSVIGLSHSEILIYAVFITKLQETFSRANGLLMVLYFDDSPGHYPIGHGWNHHHIGPLSDFYG
ncbi:hypothetical protein SDC9_211916 [bioreactor metagenome]|uniref:Uncharacterized protein n=1 Tax=bioreactor metagenome TaxID=1076179 RepID=A0A645JKF3_9ZZZZ